ncbi:hypothetical protein OAF63_01435 [Saprospiraceae bacterium]|jgi:hypothetical protein|nr:hypothetical protein [Bacteroidota bacterium]MDB4727426.1 hypothetical protein [Saprospiraceae bacterium]
MKIKFTPIVLIVTIFGLSCTQVQSNKATPLNPNGDSELALLMREMFDDGMRIKEQIKKGETPKVSKVFKEIHTVEATEPEKANSPEFEVFADAYLSSLEGLKNAASPHIPQSYNGVVESCMNCHRAMCPGPMVRIKKLYLEEEE